jgi:putative transposase
LRGKDAMRYMITDELWAVMGPLVKEAKRYKCGKRPQLPDRAFFEAVLYLGRTGVPLRDLPGEFGRWDAVYNRWRRWVSTGSLTKLFELLTDAPECEGVKRVLIDSTIVRAHRHAAGALQKRGARRSKAWGGAGAVLPARF